MIYVKDEKILERIGINNISDMYAIYTKGEVISSESIDNENKIILSMLNDNNEQEIDNSNCDADFEKVSSDYQVLENYMYGDIKVYKKNNKHT